MSISQSDVRRLVAAGVIDSPTGDSILAFESGRAREAGREMPSFVELVVYLAAAIVGAGVTVLIGTSWGDLPAAARMAIPGFAAVVALLSGYALGAATFPAAGRAKAIAWLLAAVLFVATAAVTAAEAGWSETTVALTAALVALPASVALWWASRTHAQLVGIAGASFLMATALASYAEDNAPTFVGLSLAVAGLLGLIATELWVLRPLISARLLTGAAMALGAFFAGLPPGPAIAEIVALMAMAILIAASIRFGTLTYTVFGVLTAFIGLVTAILRHIDNPTLAAVALIAVGLALLAAIGVINRYRPWRTKRAGSPPAPPARKAS